MRQRLFSILAIAALAAMVSACSGSPPAVNPVKGVQVKLIKAAGTSTSVLTTDATGAVDFGVLRAGGYSVVATVPVIPPAKSTDPAKPAKPPNGKATVTVASGKGNPVSKQLTATASSPTRTSVDLPKVTFQADGVTRVIVTIKS